jgi:hypothetical protein
MASERADPLDPLPFHGVDRAETKLTDPLGYGWWGDDPATGTWRDAVEHPRELTFRVPTARP